MRVFDTPRDLLITVKLKEFKVFLLSKCTHGNSPKYSIFSCEIVFFSIFSSQLETLKKQGMKLLQTWNEMKFYFLVGSEWERQENCKESIQLQARNLLIFIAADSIIRKICRLCTKIPFPMHPSTILNKLFPIRRTFSTISSEIIYNFRFVSTPFSAFVYRFLICCRSIVSWLFVIDNNNVWFCCWT